MRLNKLINLVLQIISIYFLSATPPSLLPSFFFGLVAIVMVHNRDCVFVEPKHFGECQDMPLIFICYAAIVTLRMKHIFVYQMQLENAYQFHSRISTITYPTTMCPINV